MVNAIDNGAKYLCEHGRISEEQWNRLMYKYKWWFDLYLNQGAYAAPFFYFYILITLFSNTLLN